MNQPIRNRILIRIVVVSVAAIFVVFLLACGQQSANVSTNTTKTETKVSPVPSASIDELASGKSVYAKNCANCHKDDGHGGKVEIEGKPLDVADLTDFKVANFTDEKITRYVVNGIPDDGMPAFKDKLSEGEIRDVIKYIRKEFHKK